MELARIQSKPRPRIRTRQNQNRRAGGAASDRPVVDPGVG